MKTGAVLCFFRFLIFSTFLVVCAFGYSQIKFDVNVSDKHLRKVERSKDARSKLKGYKKYYRKDSVKAAKKAWKAYRKEHKDSLKSVGKWKAVKGKKIQFIRGEWDPKPPKQYTVDTTLFEVPKDSMDWAMQELAKEGDFETIRQVYESYGQYDSTYLDRFKMDSVQLSPEELADRFDTKDRLKKYLPEELRQESDLSIDNRMKYGQLDSFGNLQKVDRSGVADFFRNINTQEFARSQVEMKAAKKKYEVLPDLSKEEEGIKRNSLKGTPWKKRLFLNGNVAIQSTSPLILDANIQLGYQWTKKLSSGVGLLYREQFTERDSTAATVSGDSHGLSVFISYDIAKGFFAYSEFQSVVNKPLIGESSASAAWQNAFLAGVGRTFNIGKKVSISTMLLYDFNHNNNTLSRRPWVPRIGYAVRF